jgi:uncharacterized protein YcsI (UPF0317 family)
MGKSIGEAAMTEMTPKEFRSLVRGGAWTDGTEMVCRGYAQANLAIVPISNPKVAFLKAEKGDVL